MLKFEFPVFVLNSSFTNEAEGKHLSIVIIG